MRALLHGLACKLIRYYSAIQWPAQLLTAVMVSLPESVVLYSVAVHAMQHLVGRLWYPTAKQTTSHWFGGYKQCSWSPHYNYAYGEYPSCPGSFPLAMVSVQGLHVHKFCFPLIVACNRVPASFCSFVSISCLHVEYVCTATANAVGKGTN